MSNFHSSQNVQLGPCYLTVFYPICNGFVEAGWNINSLEYVVYLILLENFSHIPPTFLNAQDLSNIILKNQPQISSVKLAWAIQHLLHGHETILRTAYPLLRLDPNHLLIPNTRFGIFQGDRKVSLN
jgi:hypothetical protein